LRCGPKKTDELPGQPEPTTHPTHGRDSSVDHTKLTRPNLLLLLGWEYRCCPNLVDIPPRVPIGENSNMAIAELFRKTHALPCCSECNRKGMLLLNVVQGMA
jgi:hypothetical protein